MKGPMQGAPTKAASTPEKNAPVEPPLSARLPPTPISEPPTSNTPSRLRPSAKMVSVKNGDDRGVLQLEAEAGELPGCLQRDNDARRGLRSRRGRRRDRPRHARGTLGVVRRGGEARGFHGQHRQHAGHQVQHHAAEEAGAEGEQQADDGEGLRLAAAARAGCAFDLRVGDAWRNGAGRGGDFPRLELTVAAGDDDDARQGLVAGLGVFGRLEVDRDAGVAAANRLRFLVDDLRAVREEADAGCGLRGFGEVRVDRGDLEAVGRALDRGAAGRAGQAMWSRLSKIDFESASLARMLASTGSVSEQLGVLRDADVLADQPVERPPSVTVSPGLARGGDLELGRQDELVLVAEFIRVASGMACGAGHLKSPTVTPSGELPAWRWAGGRCHPGSSSRRAGYP